MQDTGSYMKKASLICGLVLTGAVLLGSGCTAQSEPATPEDSKARCIGKSCGDPCESCEEGNLSCSFGEVLRSCDADGRCVKSPVCGRPLDDVAVYQPCASKACGESCKLCAPDDGDCAETAIVKQCDREQRH